MTLCRDSSDVNMRDNNDDDGVHAASFSRTQGDGGDDEWGEGSRALGPLQSGLQTRSTATRRSSKSRKRKAQSKQKRLKKPYSSNTLMNCLLDLEYGNTDAKVKGEGNQEFQWDIQEYVEVLDREN